MSEHFAALKIAKDWFREATTDPKRFEGRLASLTSNPNLNIPLNRALCIILAEVLEDCPEDS